MCKCVFIYFFNILSSLIKHNVYTRLKNPRYNSLSPENHEKVKHKSLNNIFSLIVEALKCHQCNSVQDTDCEDITEWQEPNNGTEGTWIVKTDEYLKECANESYKTCVKINQSCKFFSYLIKAKVVV